MIIPSGTAHQVHVWTQQKWRKWFWETNKALGKLPVPQQWGRGNSCSWVLTNANVLYLLWWNFLTGLTFGQIFQHAEGFCWK
jgi:hypothetical protein